MLTGGKGRFRKSEVAINKFAWKQFEKQNYRYNLELKRDLQIKRKN